MRQPAAPDRASAERGADPYGRFASATGGFAAVGVRAQERFRAGQDSAADRPEASPSATEPAAEGPETRCRRRGHQPGSRTPPREAPGPAGHGGAARRARRAAPLPPLRHPLCAGRVQDQPPVRDRLAGTGAPAAAPAGAGGAATGGVSSQAIASMALGPGLADARDR